jgi:hypothetical protein
MLAVEINAAQFDMLICWRIGHAEWLGRFIISRRRWWRVIGGSGWWRIIGGSGQRCISKWYRRRRQIAKWRCAIIVFVRC